MEMMDASTGGAGDSTVWPFDIASSDEITVVLSETDVASSEMDVALSNDSMSDDNLVEWKPSTTSRIYDLDVQSPQMLIDSPLWSIGNILIVALISAGVFLLMNKLISLIKKEKDN